jgi:hypothetical protein
MRRSIPLALAAGLTAPAAAQQFVNGTFDTSLAGWTVANTSNGVGAPGMVATIDIDGPGPLPASPAAKFSAGQVTQLPNAQEGVLLTQSLSLTGGASYAISFDWLANNGFVSSASECGVFAAVVNGVPLTSQSAGALNGLASAHGHIQAAFTAPSSGSYAVGIRVTRPYIAATLITQYVDNAVFQLTAAACYANCDNSTVPPILNANDFQCFLQRFAAGDAYANCDGSVAPPVLTANDFQCFLNKYAAGDSYANCDGSTIPPVLNANDFQCFLNKFAAGDLYANCDGSFVQSVFTANDFQCFLNAFAAGCS